MVADYPHAHEYEILFCFRFGPGGNDSFVGFCGGLDFV